METLCRLSYWGTADLEKRLANALRTTCCATVRLHGRRRGYEIDPVALAALGTWVLDDGGGVIVTLTVSMPS